MSPTAHSSGKAVPTRYPFRASSGLRMSYSPRPNPSCHREACDLQLFASVIQTLLRREPGSSDGRQRASGEGDEADDEREHRCSEVGVTQKSLRRRVHIGDNVHLTR